MQQQRNLWQSPFTSTCHPSRSNGGTPIPPARHQPSIRSYCPIPISSTRPINPGKPAPTRNFCTDNPSDVNQSCLFHQIHFIRFIIRSPRPINRAKPEPPSHFLTNTPNVVIQSCLFHQITCPSKPFSNQHFKSCYPVRSFSSDSSSGPPD